ERVGQVGSRAATLVHVAATLLQLGQHAAFAEAAASIDALVPLLEPQDVLAVRRSLHHYRAESAADRGDRARLLAETAARDTLPVEDWSRPSMEEYDAHRFARLCLVEGRHAEALDVVRRRLALSAPGSKELLDWRGMEIRCLAGLGLVEGLGPN